MVEDLFDGEMSGRPAVTYSLIAATLIVSGSTLLVPSLYGVFGGIGTLTYPWQRFSSAFEHGWAGFPLLPHLAVSLILMLVVGVASERMLGAFRFLLLTLLALGFYWIARGLTGMEFNGASVFIWSYSPIVLLGLLHTSRHGGTGGPVYDRLRSVLVVMWVVIPIALGGLAMSRGAHPLLAVPLANAFHISAVAAGAASALAWKGHVARRLSSAVYDRTRLDTLASRAAPAIPVFFLLVLLLVGLGAVK